MLAELEWLLRGCVALRKLDDGISEMNGYMYDRRFAVVTLAGNWPKPSSRLDNAERPELRCIAGCAELPTIDTRLAATSRKCPAASAIADTTGFLDDGFGQLPAKVRPRNAVVTYSRFISLMPSSSLRSATQAGGAAIQFSQHQLAVGSPYGPGRLATSLAKP